MGFSLQCVLNLDSGGEFFAAPRPGSVPAGTVSVDQSLSG